MLICSLVCISQLIFAMESVDILNYEKDDRSDDGQSKGKQLKLSSESSTDENLDDDLEFPSNLEGFGYHFNDERKLRSLNLNKPFNFQVRPDDPNYNQLHYEKLGDVITTVVYELLEKETNLKKIPVPIDPQDNEPQSFIFMSEDALLNKDKLLVLIHGSGVVRAGQWARRLIINDCLDSGTQIPFIKKAMEENYGVIVMNSNDNYRIIDSKTVPIRGSERPELHVRYVWDHFIKDANAQNISFIAHSYGGVALLDLAINCFEEVKSRISAVAFTDSVHSLTFQKASPAVASWLCDVSRNWVASGEPLDTPIYGRRPADDVDCVSAGHIKHEMTSWSSFSSIFKFFLDRNGKKDVHQEL